MLDNTWEDLTIDSKQVVSETMGTVEIEWKLNRTCPVQWGESFSQAGGKKTGSIGYVHSDPIARSGVIRWRVPIADLEDAHRHVKARVQATNERYRQLLAQREVQDAQARAASEEADRRLSEARAKLDNLD